MPIAPRLQNEPFWHLSSDAVARLFETDTEQGLTAGVVIERQQLFGRNTFEATKKTGGFKIFLNQLKSPLIFVLIVAGIVTVAISHYRDAIFIFFAVIVNAVLGYWQENKAERALAELKTYLKQRARVIRDGIEREIDAEEIVPGDLIRLAQGDRVPADARLVYVNDVQVDESVLTGESMPVAKAVDAVSATVSVADQTSMIFAGTLVTQGVCSAVVCRTDAGTELGKIASLLTRVGNEKTPLQKAIIKFSVSLSILLGFLTLAVFVIGILSGRPGLEMFLTSVAIAVSAIPEGLPISMTVILAIGVERMARRKGVVRKLIAAEALGGTTVILTDKTGTLTMAQMILSQVVPFRMDEQQILRRALANAEVLIENPHDDPHAWRMNGRIMETSLMRSVALRGVAFSQLTDKSHVLQSLPFNAQRKFSASLIKEGDRHLIVLFGAPDILLRHSSLDEEKMSEVHARIEALAVSGERVLGLATKEIERTEDFSFTHNFQPDGFSFDGLITFRDPVRPGIHQSIDRVRQAGIKTVIVTGDHRGTAVAVAKEVGITLTDDSVLDASEFATLSDSQLLDRLPRVTVISRVTPSDKLRIVQLFQQLGEVVAMTGDGVNDAPAIKQANVGIAMGSGTEVAHSVADLVLLDDNFETIVSAVEEGRQILGNIRKVLVYLLSNTADGLILIGGSIVAGIPLPLNALQILWVNFIADSFPAVAFAFEKETDGLRHRPSGKTMALFSPLMKFLILVIGLSTSAFLFVAYWVLLKLGYDPVLVRTFIFASFGTYTLLVALSVRSLEQSIFSYPVLSNRYLAGGIAVGFALMAGAIYFPPLQLLLGTVSLPFLWVLGVILIGILNIVLIECAKHFYKKR